MLTGDELRDAHGRFLEGLEPPHWVIERARRAAVQSPCSKSKRGAAIYDPEHEGERIRSFGIDPRAPDPDTEVHSRAANTICYAHEHNGPPAPYRCDGSFECRMDCPKICMHAEQRAILSVIGLTELNHLELVHVKVVDGLVVPGGPPSCWQCSRLVVEVKLKGVWLYETQTIRGDDISDDQIRELRAATDSTPGNFDAEWADVALGLEPGEDSPSAIRTARDVCARWWNRVIAPGLWRFYTAPAFHEATASHERNRVANERPLHVVR